MIDIQFFCQNRISVNLVVNRDHNFVFFSLVVGPVHVVEKFSQFLVDAQLFGKITFQL